MKRKQKNKYDPKLKTVKHLELIDQNKTRLILNIASKVCKFPGHASSHSILNMFCSNFRYLKFRHYNL